MQRNGEAFDAAFAAPAYGPDDVALLRPLPPLRLVAIAEDWCPDVYHTLPTWARIVRELPWWELRVFARDAHPELMDTFLSERTARRIPVYAFYSAEGWLQVWWSGRGFAAERALDDVLAGRSYDALEPEEKARAGAVLADGYPREFRRANFAEILRLLAAFYHLG